MSEQIVSQTSSIGAVWPPTESSNGRIKGFYNGLVATPKDVEDFIGEFANYQSEAENHSEIDRLSIRTVAHAGAIAMLDSAGISLEGAMPIRGSDDTAIVYTAWNAPERTVPDTQLDEHSRVLASTVAVPLQPTHAPQNVRLKTLDKYTDENIKIDMVEDLATLYQSFGYDARDVEDLVLNPANTIAYIEDEQGIVSTAMAEKVTLSVEGHGEIKIAEITEAITRPADRGKGFYRIISGYLVNQLLDNRKEQLDVIYGESNLAVKGVLIAAHQNGRRFSYFDRQNMRVGQPGFGIIQQSFKVEDNSETRPYNDFALSYLPLE